MFTFLTQTFADLTYKIYENVGINKILYIFGKPIWLSNLVTHFQVLTNRSLTNEKGTLYDIKKL